MSASAGSTGVGRTGDFVSGAQTINWEERKDARKIEFAEGVQVVGILTDVKRIQVKDSKTGILKPAVRYTVREQGEEEPGFFFGTYQIDEKLSPRDVGHFISVTCKGEDKAVSRNGNAMKVFAVQVSKEAAPGWATSGTQISDDDLPF